MNDNTNFKVMLKMMYDMQVPIITVEFLSEKLYGDKYCTTHHIIVASGKDKVTDICFVDGHSTNNNYLFSMRALEMTFEEAVIKFSKMTIKCQGSVMTVQSI